MWIKRLRMSNFRQYRDTTIDFPDPSKSGVTVVQGPNGAGKTNILNALSWCFYGQELHLDKKNLGLPIYHTGLLETLHAGQVDKVEVETTLQLTSGAEILVTRGSIFRCAGKGELVRVPHPGSLAPDGSSCDVTRVVGQDYKPVPEADAFVSKLLPKGIEGYFFFDGERLRRYFEETSDQDVYQSVLNISQVDLLIRLLAHLKKEEAGFRKDEQGQNPLVEEAAAELAAHEGILSKLQGELAELRENKSKVEKAEREATEKLRSVAPENIDRLQDERTALEEDVRHLTALLDGFEASTFETALEIYPTLIADGAIREYGELLGHSKEAGQIPPAYRQSFLRQLLKDGVCICGCRLEPGSAHYRAIQKLLGSTSPLSEISVELIEQGGVLRELVDYSLKSKTRLEELSRNIKSNQEQLTLKNNRLAQVNQLMADSDVEQVRDLESRIQRYKDSGKTLQTSIGAKTEQITREQDAVDAARRRHKEELSKDQKHAQLLAIMNFCQAAETAAETAKNEILSDMRQEIEKRTQEYFLNLIWKRETYKTVKIDADYNVSVEHQSGLQSLGTLSAGEQQVLALSFVAALTSVSGFNAPLVIDTPLARISGEPRISVATNLPKYLSQKQLILLMTEEEYTPSVRDAMKGSVGREWRIVFTESASGSEAQVVPYAR